MHMSGETLLRVLQLEIDIMLEHNMPISELDNIADEYSVDINYLTYLYQERVK